MPRASKPATSSKRSAPPAAAAPSVMRVKGRGMGLDTRSLHQSIQGWSWYQRMLRFNPLRVMTSEYLANALDNFVWGYLRDWAILAYMIMERDDTLPGVSGKRKKDTSHREREVIKFEGFEDDPEADEHKEVLEEFWATAQCVDAFDRNKRGGIRQLIYQMGECDDFRYNFHHIMWEPRAGALRATFEGVPTFFFENTTGVARFIPDGTSTFGEDMDLQDWLVCAGDGLMIPCSILWWFKRNSFLDWGAFNEKFSIPGIVGMTASPPNSPEAQAMQEAVESLSNDWSSVICGAQPGSDPIKILETAGKGSIIPMQELINYCNRRFIELYRGSDLGTTSQKDATGASLQGEESDIIAVDNAARRSESLRGPELTVLRWWFGDDVTPKAGLRIQVPKDEDLRLILAAIQILAPMGAPFGVTDVLRRFGFSEPQKKAELLKVAQMEQPDPAPNMEKAHINKAMRPEVEADAGKEMLQLLAEAGVEDRAELRTSLHDILRMAPGAGQLHALQELLPTLPEMVGKTAHQQRRWAEILGTSLKEGFDL